MHAVIDWYVSLVIVLLVATIVCKVVLHGNCLGNSEAS